MSKNDQRTYGPASMRVTAHTRRFAERLQKVVGPYRAAIANGRLDEALRTGLREAVDMSDAELSALRATPLWSGMVALAPTWARELEAIERLGPGLERYRDLTARTLLLLGGATQPHLRLASSALAEILPNVRTALLDGQGHFANLAAPDLVAREVADFLLAAERDV